MFQIEENTEYYYYYNDEIYRIKRLSNSYFITDNRKTWEPHEIDIESSKHLIFESSIEICKYKYELMFEKIQETKYIINWFKREVEEIVLIDGIWYEYIYEDFLKHREHQRYDTRKEAMNVLITDVIESVLQNYDTSKEELIELINKL